MRRIKRKIAFIVQFALFMWIYRNIDIAAYIMKMQSKGMTSETLIKTLVVIILLETFMIANLIVKGMIAHEEKSKYKKKNKTAYKNNHKYDSRRDYYNRNTRK